ncbi:unnamed protein product, partial [Amoebophrya sp. A25]|eukprot:GSA25T00018144001.1
MQQAPTGASVLASGSAANNVVTMVGDVMGAPGSSGSPAFPTEFEQAADRMVEYYLTAYSYLLLQLIAGAAALVLSYTQ